MIWNLLIILIILSIITWQVLWRVIFKPLSDKEVNACKHILEREKGSQICKYAVKYQRCPCLPCETLKKEMEKNEI